MKLSFPLYTANNRDYTQNESKYQEGDCEPAVPHNFLFLILNLIFLFNHGKI